MKTFVSGWCSLIPWPIGNNSAEGNGAVCQPGRPQEWLLSVVQGIPTYFTRLIFTMQILLGAISQLKTVGSGVYHRNGTIQISAGQMPP